MAGGDGPQGRGVGARKHERGDVRIAAEIRESGAGKQKISVIDLSRSGFRMHCLFYIPHDRTVYLTLPGFASLEAHIAWQDGDYYGCEFHQPLHEAIFEHLLRAYPALGNRL